MSKPGKIFSKRPEDTTNLIDFSFCNKKSEYEYLFGQTQNNSIIEDRADFWKFINKYESMLRNAGQPILNSPLSDDILFNKQQFHKRKYIPFQFIFKDKTNRNSDRWKCSDLKEKQFKELLLIYLDFKQKEKFNKLKKLRKAQKALPIAGFKNQLKENLNNSSVLIIAGDTGCGKSTQVPQYLYSFGYKKIACTQPRRLACVSLSKRVSHEMLEDYGTKVGFQIRFEKNKVSTTNIVFITEGLLLRQLAVEDNLDQYDAIILDEIHERNLNGDFLLGVTKCLLRAKPNIKLILMSATINVNLFYNYFKEEGAILLEVPGRLYPIKTMFMPPVSVELKSGKAARMKTSTRLDPAPYVQVISLIDQKYPNTERGDVLIFVSGVNEITTVFEAIKDYAEQNNHWIILPLHSGLSLADQDKVFDYAPDGMRKCIISTNIAETSLTVDGIRFVIDSGKVKEMSYDSSCKGQRLKEFWVSKSSAEQRKGRAGRTGPGTCFRLFSEKEYSNFEDYPTPEIFRVPLDNILLQMISMGLANVRLFPFIESPKQESIEQTILQLKQHNTLTFDEKITPLGTSLSNLPVEISIGKMLLMGCVFPDVEKILTLSAIMSVQNPFTNRAYTDRKCEDERSYLDTDQGDIFILMRAYYEWLLLKYNGENSKKWAYKLGIEEQRFYEITKLRNQFQNILDNCNMATSNRVDESSLTKSERMRRHGEIRMLKAIKRKQKYEEPRKRKILKHNHNLDEEDFRNDREDIRDVDFRLNNDSNKMEILLRSSKIDKHRDVALLKLIIASGFYPQLAIADDFNYCKGGTQQFFHTFLKPFISIHPNTYFAKYFDILKLNDSDILEKPKYYTPKQLMSNKHQILCYQNLLETAKPYLMNCIRLPSAQTLLLFSYAIDTNESITRIVCDSWLCLEFPIPETGSELFGRAIKLRRTWLKLLSQKLKDQSIESQLEETQKKKTDDNIKLWESLIDFMNVNIVYTIKRLLPADIKSLYTERNISNFKKLTVNPFADDFPITFNESKGGINVSENIVVGCLQEVKWTIAMDDIVSEFNWKCPKCSFEMKLNILEKLVHKKVCDKNASSKNDSTFVAKDKAQNLSKHSHETVEYNCDICKRKLILTKIGALRHKKSCVL